ncbi:MAG TPA: apolipoprotein N-acyltransferase [Rhodothermia bacterium]
MLQRTPYAGALLTGLLMGIAFPPGFLGAMAWVGLVPLFMRLLTVLDWRRVVLESVVASGITTMIVGYWTLFHPIPSARAAALAGLVALALTSSIPFWMFGIPGKQTSPVLRLGLLLCSAVIIEYAHFHTEIGFPWLALGHTQATLSPVNQLATFIGAPGLSVWVLVSNGLILHTVLGTRRQRGIASAAFGLFLLASLILGFLRLRSERDVVDRFEVLAVQPALPAEAWSDVHDRTRLLRLIELTKDAVDPNIDLIVWPETTLPVLEARDEPSKEYVELSSFVDSAGIPLLTGAVIEEEHAETGQLVYYNSAVVLSPLVGITGRYDKRIPVPFAERVPYLDRYPWLERLAVKAGGVSGYGIGTRPGKIQIDGTSVGIMICFESAFGRATRSTEPETPAYFVVLAQDGWWGNTAGYQQHFAITRLRAIETGRAIVQVTVTGTTGLILPDGSSVGDTEWMERVAVRFQVPAYVGSTPYTRFGDIPILALCLLFFVSGYVKYARVHVHKSG